MGCGGGHGYEGIRTEAGRRGEDARRAAGGEGVKQRIKVVVAIQIHTVAAVREWSFELSFTSWPVPEPRQLVVQRGSAKLPPCHASVLSCRHADRSNPRLPNACQARSRVSSSDIESPD